MPIQDHFIHTVLYMPQGGVDEWGDPATPATPEQVGINARVEWDRHVIRDQTGREITCVGVVFLDFADLPLCKAGDRLEFESHVYSVERADRMETDVPFPGDNKRAHWMVHII